MTFRVLLKPLAITLTLCTAAYSKPKAAKTYGNLPLSFEANAGQSDARVRFLSRGSGYTLFLTRDEAVIRLQKAKKQAAVHLRMVDANPKVKITGQTELPGKSNYFIGNDPTKWHTGVPTYGKVAYQGVYRGIDLVYYGNQGRLEYDFVVAPGADPRRIGLDLGRQVKIDPQGDLVVTTDVGEARFQKPVAYQLTGERKTMVDAGYSLVAGNRVSFQLASYDRAKPIIIDPVLSYSTYLGGSSDEISIGVTVDGAGNAYVTGETYSSDFPTANPEQSTFGGGQDVFVTKINASGTAIVYSTYLGGTGNDQGFDIAVDSAGDAYVGGATFSSNFPTVNPFQAFLNGPEDAFIAKLSPTGNQLLYSTYLGGSSDDEGLDIAIDSLGDAYLVGDTLSTDFPVVNPLQGTSPGIRNGFVTKLNASGSALVYSTYLGGSLGAVVLAVAVDRSMNTYVTGLTGSTDFPTVNPIQSTMMGVNDAFVTKFNSTGSALTYSTYLGGSADDRALGIAVDASGNAYVSGYTASANFPVKNAIQPNYGGNGDRFVTKINAHGTALVYSTYLGGSGVETFIGYPKAIAVDKSGNVYVAGSTYSTDFPTMNPTQASNTGLSDAFVTKLNAAGSALIYSSYLGGTGNEDYSGNGAQLAIDPAGNIYVYGSTNSTNFPTVNPIQPALAGGYDAFLTKISSGVSLNKKKLTFPTQVVGTTSATSVVTLTNLGNNTLTITSIAVTGDFAQTNTCSSVTSGGSCTIDVTFTPLASGTLTGDITITDSEIDSPQTISLTGTGTDVRLSPTHFNFGMQRVGTTSRAKSFTVTNVGSATLNLSNITIAGADPADFAIATNTCGTMLGVGANCTVSVTFTPTITGARSATLSISDDGGGSPQTVSLAGTGM